jgi:hypothetical protein
MYNARYFTCRSSHMKYPVLLPGQFVRSCLARNNGAFINYNYRHYKAREALSFTFKSEVTRHDGQVTGQTPSPTLPSLALAVPVSVIAVVS